MKALIRITTLIVLISLSAVFTSCKEETPPYVNGIELEGEQPRIIGEWEENQNDKVYRTILFSDNEGYFMYSDSIKHSFKFVQHCDYVCLANIKPNNTSITYLVKNCSIDYMELWVINRNIELYKK